MQATVLSRICMCTVCRPGAPRPKVRCAQTCNPWRPPAICEGKSGSGRVGVSRKNFIESHGATCRNWTWSWSFVNHKEKFVIFGVWEHNLLNNDGLILSRSWELSERGNRQPGYTQGIEHIDLVGKQGYRLFVFQMRAAPRPASDPGAAAKISTFERRLQEKRLVAKADGWYAHPK